MSKKAFTLIELLVVIAILSLLISILMPSLNQAKILAMQVKCLARVSGIGRACHIYASDYSGWNPWRDPDKSVMPHCTHSDWGGFDLDETFLEPYVGSRDAAFCPSKLMKVRNPETYPPTWTDSYVTYQYNNIANGGTAGLWVYDEIPNLTRVDTPTKRYALWGCMTLYMPSIDVWFGHDRPIVSEPPAGQSTVFTDGSGQFVTMDNLDIFWTLIAGQDWYWAIPG